MRRNAPYSTYNRAIAFHEARVGDRDNLLSVLAVNEVQMLYLMVRWAGCTDTGYALAGLKIEPKGAFARPTKSQVMAAARNFR